MRSGRRLAALLAVLVATPHLALGTAPAHAEEPAPPPVSARPPGFVDALAPGPGLDARLEEIRRKVQDALRYPPLARRRGQTGEAVVGFVIGAGRSASEIRTERSSGVALLDRAAERAVRDATPLPPVYGRIEVPVRFELAKGR